MVLLCTRHVFFLISSASVRFIPLLSFIEPIIAWKFPLVSLIFLKRSLQDVFRNRFYDLNSCISSYPEKHWIPSWWHHILMNNKKPFVKKTFLVLSPPSPKPYILTFPHCCFGAVSQSYLKCCLPGCSRIVPQIKLNSQLSSCKYLCWHSTY